MPLYVIGSPTTASSRPATPAAGAGRYAFKEAMCTRLILPDTKRFAEAFMLNSTHSITRRPNKILRACCYSQPVQMFEMNLRDHFFRCWRDNIRKEPAPGCNEMESGDTAPGFRCAPSGLRIPVHNPLSALMCASALRASACNS